ncbi:putative glucan 1,3-beta-glucosidase D [Fulvia fulva]|uniref:glucan 1,3-beta-glucosidase n=1 Tax=Passalora fulva TaxID=5499 RepID=A0A9Q8P2V9_PASFU|nr:putative glucan 1,3-beta-glucosidase D [Fulvia fulva]KAK4635300.1 putative glucan 1,3-beta-glucosidase D [Fulvia fulva]KAK4637980.1 putative glucan 1,3-beta-glucosidase D [Fulvia fulva]UJO11174.1 putative glucan 1,3-beta-glucosidase D [Fulvia fulva]WPV10275.1 putative glucan 1,3-beta-glucosidase D [Fulvia fulva]WPV24626.1 putative glucan 1,3-beta-glucosidase D [Fulvia fulva]
MPSSHTPRDSPARRQRRRRTHQRTDSNGEVLGRYDRDRDREEDHGSPTKSRPRRSHHERRSSRAPESEYTSSRTNTTALSSGQLAQLDKLNRKLGWNDYEGVPQTRPREEAQHTRAEYDVDREREREEREIERERRREEHRERKRRRREEERAALAAEEDSVAYEHPSNYKHERRRERNRDGRRVASGQVLERGRGSSAYYSEKEDYREVVRRRDGGSSDLDYDEQERKRKRRKKIFIGVGIVIVLLAIIIPAAVVVSGKSHNSSSGAGGAGDNSTTPANSNLAGISEDDIPKDAQGTILDPFTWYDTDDFNVTYTAETVGGLSVMGLNSTWDDSTRANDQVPPLNEEFTYGTMPIRGVNIGGWLSIEPFITPSLFSGYTTHDNVVDEYTLTQKLGPTTAKSTLEKHYSSWAQESTFSDIQAAGFDHVRIPFSYWAVTTYDGDPYVPQVSWRYLLRGIEWARKYGLRINLDLHGAPGSQNGWNHSGRQGTIGWLNGTDGTTNGDRTIDIHKQLSAFFTQPRYKNIVTMYGLVNEPRMVELDQSTVLTWTSKAIDAVRGNNFTGIVVFGDGFMGLDNWQGKLTNEKNLLLDVHQYVIFNVDQIVLNHHDKINFACGGWTQQALRSQNTATGFGPTLCGEWSQADTDCAQYLNNVGVGSRWEGTLNMVSGPGGSTDGSVLNPTCPTKNNPQCSCDGANADPGSWSDEYKKWLLLFAEAQMHSFEQGWGWFYWTWQTESAAQWSYKAGLAAGTMPKVAYTRDFDCSQDIPQFEGLPENY